MEWTGHPYLLLHYSPVGWQAVKSLPISFPVSQNVCDHRIGASPTERREPVTPHKYVKVLDRHKHCTDTFPAKKVLLCPFYRGRT